MKSSLVSRALVAGVLLGSVLMTGSAAGAAGERAAVYGGDLTPPERQELSDAFGMESADAGETVTTPELAAALEGTGLTIVPTDRTISSAGLTCLEKGAGLTVQTRNITRMTSSVYANALVTAGVGDASVIVAAPSSNPVSGETALVGVLKAFPQCQGGKPPEPARVRLAYEQLGHTLALAGPDGDIGKASTVMLKAAQPVIMRQATDDGAIGTALDAAAGAEGVQVSQGQRPELIAFLKRLGGVDYGTYAQGYQVQQIEPNEVKVSPAGAGSGSGGAQGAAGAAGAGAAGAAAAAQSAPAPLTGEMRQTGQPLVVRANGQDRQVTPAANVVVVRDGRPAQLSDLRSGDTVTTSFNADGTAQRIEATSAAGWPWWLLPLLALLLLVPLLFWFLAKRRKDHFIVERKVTTATTTVAPGAESTATERSQSGSRR